MVGFYAAEGNMSKKSLDEKFGLLDKRWRPKVIARLNGQEVKIVKVQGVFPWHTREQEDEFFLVWHGKFRVEFRNRVVELGQGEAIVAEHGVEHRTAADEETNILIFEPAEVRNTGNVEDDVFTAPNSVAI